MYEVDPIINLDDRDDYIKIDDDDSDDSDDFLASLFNDSADPVENLIETNSSLEPVYRERVPEINAKHMNKSEAGERQRGSIASRRHIIRSILTSYRYANRTRGRFPPQNG